jgi:hypothetical protein
MRSSSGSLGGAIAKQSGLRRRVTEIGELMCEWDLSLGGSHVGGMVTVMWCGPSGVVRFTLE